MWASCPAFLRAKLARRSHDLRQPSRSSFWFQSRCFWPKPSGPMPRMAFQKLFLVPVPVFLAKAIRANAAHGQQDMGVWVVALGVVNHHVGHHATLYEVGTGKVPH